MRTPSWLAAGLLTTVAVGSLAVMTTPASAATDEAGLAAFTFTGLWQIPNGTATNERFSNEVGATAVSTVDIGAGGGTIAVTGIKGPTLGIAEIQVGTATPMKLDLYQASTWSHETLFETPKLAEGPQKVTIKVTGEKRAAATMPDVNVVSVRTSNGVIAENAPTTPPPTTPPAALDDPVVKEKALQITSTAENSTVNWWEQYGYIEDIGDGRGYTGGIVGFTSGTSDMLKLIENYTAATPTNGLSKFIDELRQIDAAPYAQRPQMSHDLLDPQGFVAAWQAEATKPAFQAAQDAERDRVYWNPALAQAKADGVGPLGLWLLYDISVNHGPGTDPESFGGIVAAAAAQSPPPSKGGSETAYLRALDAKRSAVLTSWGDNQPNGRDEATRELIDAGEFALEVPVTWHMYGDAFTMSTNPTPRSSTPTTPTEPAPAVKVTATATGGNAQATLNWDAVNVPDPATAGVWVQKADGTAGKWYRELKGSHVFTGLTNGTAQTFEVFVVRDGVTGNLASATATATPTAGTTTPASPASLEVKDFTLTGNWISALNGAERWTADTAAKATVKFTAKTGGSTVTFRAGKHPDYRTAKVQVDNGTAVSINQQGPETDVNVPMWTSPVLPAGEHTLTITVGTPEISVMGADVSNGTFTIGTTTPTQPAGPAAGMTVRFEDNFDTKSVGTSGARWAFTSNSYAQGNRNPGDNKADHLVNSAITVSGGIAKITATKRSDGYWNTGLLTTEPRNDTSLGGNNVKLQPGDFYVARVKLPSGNTGAWAGMWSWQPGSTQPGVGEIDVFEHHADNPNLFETSNKINRTGGTYYTNANLIKPGQWVWVGVKLTDTSAKYYIGSTLETMTEYHSDNTGLAGARPHPIVNLSVVSPTNPYHAQPVGTTPITMEIDRVAIYRP